MSFTVLVIPEDPMLNGHILKPLAKAIMADAGRPAAKVDVLSNPRLRGYGHAVKALRSGRLERYNFKDLWLFFPDADKATEDAMRALEAHVAVKGATLLCCAAQPEVEIYACAAFRNELPGTGTWKEARCHPRMKEKIFVPLLDKYGDRRRAGAGRDLMISASLDNLPLLFRLCPELLSLRARIAAHLEAPGTFNPAPHTASNPAP